MIAKPGGGPAAATFAASVAKHRSAPVLHAIDIHPLTTIQSPWAIAAAQVDGRVFLGYKSPNSIRSILSETWSATQSPTSCEQKKSRKPGPRDLSYTRLKPGRKPGFKQVLSKKRSNGIWALWKLFSYKQVTVFRKRRGMTCWKWFFFAQSDLSYLTSRYQFL